MKNKKRKNLLSQFFLAVCLAMLAFSSWQLYRQWKEDRDSIAVYEEIQSKAIVQRDTVENAEEEPMETAPLTIDFAALLQENADVIGWIYSPDTPISYPIAQSSDNDYYLRRLLNGSYNVSGTLFADYRTEKDFSGWTSLIYGHNMQNDSMFGTLPNYKNEEYYQAHPFLYLFTPDADYKVEVIGGFVTEEDDLLYQAYGDQEEKNRLLAQVHTNANYESGVEVKEEDCLLILSTCSYESERSRFVLVGVLRKLAK